MKFIYDVQIPESLVPILKERFEPLGYLAPAWCEHITITYQSENPDGYVMSCASEYNYRFAQINVYDVFFGDPNWKASIIHEIIHIITAPYTSQIWPIIEMAQLDDNIKNYIQHQLTGAEEALAQDTTALINKLTTS